MSVSVLPATSALGGGFGATYPGEPKNLSCSVYFRWTYIFFPMDSDAKWYRAIA